MAGAFPTSPNNLDLHTTDGGTVYQYKSDHGRWVLYKDSSGIEGIDAHLMIGSANAQYVPVSVDGSYNAGKSKASTYISNVSAGSYNLRLTLGLPTNRGGLKLFVAGTLVSIFDADASDYVSNRIVNGMNHTGVTEIDNQTVNLTTQGRHVDGFGATDCSGFDEVALRLVIESATADELDLAALALLCYYDT